MEEYKRTNPLFSLCGLNCGLCPRFNTEGESKCPGCGGKDFNKKHPSCKVINCSKQHNNVDYCFNCNSFKCNKYLSNTKDSFITYKNVNNDLTYCIDNGIDKYMEILNKKIDILKFLLKKYNNGRLKNFYCISVNLLSIEDLNDIMETINKNDIKEIDVVVKLIEDKAKEKNIELKLRK